MIVMFLSHPVAFICCLISYGSLAGAYDLLDKGEPSAGVACLFMVAMYLIAYVVLPWWTQPIALWRYWRNRPTQTTR